MTQTKGKHLAWLQGRVEELEAKEGMTPLRARMLKTRRADLWVAEHAITDAQWQRLGDLTTQSLLDTLLGRDAMFPGSYKLGRARIQALREGRTWAEIDRLTDVEIDSLLEREG